MKKFYAVSRYLLPIFLTFTFVLTNISITFLAVNKTDTHSVLAKEEEVVEIDLTKIVSFDDKQCHPNSGWVWSKGSSRPEIADRVQQALLKMGIDALVEASSMGETDSCDTFKLYAIDFTIEVKNLDPNSEIGYQIFTERINSVLLDYAKPNLGHTKILFPHGKTVYLGNETRESYLQDDLLESETIAENAIESQIFQVDASQPWQSSGIFVDANEAVTMAVASGLWTHWMGVAPYNNGVGGSYICADNNPPNQCVEPLPTAPQGALIGKIGSQIFEVGSGTTVTFQQSGTLYLRINDSDAGLFDNDGVLTLDIDTLSLSEPFLRRVYVVVYDPLLENGQNLSDYLGWADHTTMTLDTVNIFQQTSHNKINYTVVDTTILTDGWPEKIDGFQYTEEEYLDVINGVNPAHSPDTVDYNKIVNDPQLDICGRVNRGEIDEVWIYNGPWFGFWESTLVGPGAYWYNSPPVPGSHACDRLIPIMGPSPERPNVIGHGEGHRMESTMTHVYGGWQQNSTSHNWERFGLVDAQSTNYSYSGCGSIHYPPNGTSDYDYGNPSFADSNCADFDNYPFLGDPATTVEPVACSAWGCDHYGFMLYWFGHLPDVAGCGPDGKADDWWKYFAVPQLANDPGKACGDDPIIGFSGLWLTVDNEVVFNWDDTLTYLYHLERSNKPYTEFAIYQSNLSKPAFTETEDVSNASINHYYQVKDAITGASAINNIGIFTYAISQ